MSCGHHALGRFVELKRTTVGAGSRCPHLSYLSDATLGLGVNIGAGTITCASTAGEKHPTKIGDLLFRRIGHHVPWLRDHRERRSYGRGVTVPFPMALWAWGARVSEHRQQAS